MSLINSAIKAYLKPRWERISYATENAIKVQEDTLLYLTNKAKDTEWGRKHSFHKIHSKKDFIVRNEIQDYETLKPYIQRNFDGEQNILWPQTIKWFSKSSGTTSDRSKFIPVSPDSLKYTHYRSGKDITAMYYLHHKNTQIFGGKCLMLTGSVAPNPGWFKAQHGDISGVLVKVMPQWINFLRTPNKNIALLPHWEEKIEKLVEITPNVDVRYIGGVPSWMLILLNKILEVKGKSDIREIWPNLQLFIHGAVSFKPYKEPFKKIIPHNDMYYYETYNASEGFFAMQDRDEPGELRLMMDYGIYYEFMPMSEWNSTNPKTLNLQEVELDTNYALVITTNGGLWRYVIGDTIKFTSIKPYRIQVTGRTKHYINTFGEELIIDNTDNAIDYACKMTGAQLKEYTAAPIYLDEKEAGGHEWFIEFDKKPNNIEVFSKILDTKLRELNSDYDAKRKGDMALRAPKIEVVQNGTFYEWMKSKGKLGAQQKIPRLQNDRHLLEEISEIRKKILE